MLNRIRALIIKELLAILRDPRGRMVLIMPPLVQLIVFSFAATLEIKNVNLAILNNDSGRLSSELVQRFKGSKTFKKIIFLNSNEDLENVIDSQKAIIAISIQNDFSERLKRGTNAPLQLILDGRKSNAAQIVQGYIGNIVAQFNRELSAQNQSSSLIIIPRNLYNPNLDYMWFTVPNLLAVITMLISLIVTALSIARERELGTFDQILVSPLESVEILIGKTVPALMIAIAEGSLILLVAITVFQVPFRGSLILLYISMIIYSLAIIGVGLFISSISKTQQQAILGTFVFMVPAVLLSGFASPVENMPSWLQVLANLNPLKHFLIIVKGLFLKDIPARIVFENLRMIVVVGAVNLFIATWFYRRKI